ncbi:unnamed protein product, partial [Mesorhabditis belari]|uniref:Peptidase S1 domain-containing protein n=1 Tax=Mesorhabditis belari TaxID=2138241 RepID=A0AAF3F370_9BILA
MSTLQECFVNGPQWTEWTTGNTACSDTCGSCGTLLATRTCLSGASCPCPGENTTIFALCNNMLCEFPRPTCCHGKTLVNGEWVCVEYSIRNKKREAIEVEPVVSRRVKRIANGENAEDDVHPYFGRVATGQNYQISAGIHEWWSNVEQSELVTEVFFTHPTMDAALGKLNATFNFTGNFVKPICLTRNTSFLAEGAPMVLYGLGLDENQQIPTIVQKVFATNLLLGGSLSTLVFANSSVGTAKVGDSGSPYLTKFNGRWYQVGFITNVYTPPSTISYGPRIAPLCDWIAETTGENLCQD